MPAYTACIEIGRARAVQEINLIYELFFRVNRSIMKYNTLAIAALVLPFLAACGQPVASPSSNVVSGAITAMTSDYSSITVAGQTYQLGSASLSAASLSAKAEAPTVPTKSKPAKKFSVNGKSATAKALSVGQKVKLLVVDGEASEIDVDLEVRGLITAIDPVAGTMVVAGRTVKLQPVLESIWMATMTPPKKAKAKRHWRTCRLAISSK
jgi:hypothetical protein